MSRLRSPSSLREPFRAIRSPGVMCGFVALALLLFCPAKVFSDVYLRLAWDANDEADLDGYRIFVRVEGEAYDYTAPDWEGTATTCTIHGLEADTDYYFVARAFDTAGNESGNSNEVFYDARANVTPTADAGPNRTVGEGTSVTLDGTNSSDADGSIAAYAWTQTGGPTVSLSDPASATPRFTAPFVGISGEVLTFELTVTDNGARTDSDTVTVNVSDSNQVPTADAGPDRTVSEGSSVTLDGSNSSDPDGSIASYTWVQTGGTNVSLSDASSETPEFTAPFVGVTGEALTFELTVTDNGALSDSDSVVINVSDVNQAPTADAGPDRTVSEGSSVTLDGTNSSDADGSIAAYAWTQTGGTTVSLSGATSAHPSFTTPDVGPGGTALTFELTVTDDGGLQSSDSCIVNVSWENLAPTADAGSDETVGEGELVTLDGTGSSDPDDGIDAYMWNQIGGTPVALSLPTSPAPHFTSPNVGVGGEALTFRLAVTDGGGLSDTDTVIINVSDSNRAPTADAGPDQVVIEGASVRLSGSGSHDTDGTIVSFMWTQTGGPAVSLAGPASEEPTFTAPDVEQGGASLVFQLTVTDDGGLQSSDRCVVNVTWEDDVPPAPPGGVTVTVED